MKELTFEERKQLIKLKSEADIQLLRACVRPVITILLLVSWILLNFLIYGAGGDYATDMPSLLTYAMMGSFIWYFGERSLQKAVAGIKSLK